MENSSKDWLQGINLSSSIPLRRRRVLVFLSVVSIGVALSWTGFKFTQNEAERANGMKFEQEASQIAVDMETVFNSSLEHLRSIPPFFAASEDVTRDEFRRFVTPALERNESLYVSAFLPRVLAADRASFEAKARADGLEDFAIRAVDGDGNATPLLGHDDYFPIYFDEPLVPEVLGIDSGSQPGRAEYLRRAADTSAAIVTPPVSLIEDSADTLSVMAFIAVRYAGTDATDKSDGVAVVIHRIRPLVEAVVGPKRLNELKIAITDPHGDVASRLVHKNFPGDVESVHRPGWPLAEYEVKFANQTWSMRLCPATGSPFAPPRPPYWILGAGSMLSILLAYSLCALIAIGGLRKQVNRALELGQYQLGEKLGEGGMGEVYEATHQMLARPAAIKLIRADNQVAANRWQSRFEREAQATAGLQSPHTVSIYDFGKTHDGTFYYVMERLHGVDLATLVESEGPLSPARAIYLLRQVCRSLAEAHAAGLIHRDIKPANIFVCHQAMEYDFAKVLDFGLVKASEGQPSVELTQAGTLLGTPAYMAPELIQDHAVDGRSDLYSLGCVAYYILTGRTVFGGTLSAVIAGHVGKKPPILGNDSADIPFELEHIVLRCLEKNPEHRPQSAAELERQLASCGIAHWTQQEAKATWQSQQQSHVMHPTSLVEAALRVTHDLQ